MADEEKVVLSDEDLEKAAGGTRFTNAIIYGGALCPYCRKGVLAGNSAYLQCGNASCLKTFRKSNSYWVTEIWE